MAAGFGVVMKKFDKLSEKSRRNEMIFVRYPNLVRWRTKGNFTGNGVVRGE
jgi:hypothetical protein